MKLSPDTQINAFFIDIYMVENLMVEQTAYCTEIKRPRDNGYKSDVKRAGLW